MQTEIKVLKRDNHILNIYLGRVEQEFIDNSLLELKVNGEAE